MLCVSLVRNMSGLQVPFAKRYHNGRRIYVLAKDSIKEDGPFACPDCERKVILRQPTVARDHFAHLPDDACVPTKSGSRGESYEHEKAKELFAERFDRFELKAMCHLCDNALKQPVPAVRFQDRKQFSCNLEHVLNAGEFRIDDSIRRNGQDHAAVEIKHMHAVGVDKMRALDAHYSGRVYEIGALDVLKQAENYPDRLVYSVNYHHSDPYRLCLSCWKKKNKPCCQCSKWLPTSGPEQSVFLAQGVPWNDYRHTYVCSGCRAKCPRVRQSDVPAAN